MLKASGTVNAHGFPIHTSGLEIGCFHSLESRSKSKEQIEKSNPETQVLL